MALYYHSLCNISQLCVVVVSVTTTMSTYNTTTTTADRYLTRILPCCVHQGWWGHQHRCTVCTQSI